MWNDECIELLTMDDNHVITQIYLCPRNRLRCTHKNCPNNWSYVWIPKDTQCWVSCNRNSSDYYTFQLPWVSLTQLKLCQRFWQYEYSRKSWQMNEKVSNSYNYLLYSYKQRVFELAGNLNWVKEWKSHPNSQQNKYAHSIRHSLCVTSGTSFRCRISVPAMRRHFEAVYS